MLLRPLLKQRACFNKIPTLKMGTTKLVEQTRGARIRPHRHLTGRERDTWIDFLEWNARPYVAHVARGKSVTIGSRRFMLRSCQISEDR